MDVFRDSGMKMFAFTSKHHEGFSMFDTKTRVKSRANWTAPAARASKLATSPIPSWRLRFAATLSRNSQTRLTSATSRLIYIFSPDWYDADFRPYVAHPLQIPSSKEWMSRTTSDSRRKSWETMPSSFPIPLTQKSSAMMSASRPARILTRYGRIDMNVSRHVARSRVWPELRKTLLMMRELQPDVMLRNPASATTATTSRPSASSPLQGNH